MVARQLTFSAWIARVSAEAASAVAFSTFSLFSVNFFLTVSSFTFKLLTLVSDWFDFSWATLVSDSIYPKRIIWKL